MTTAVLDTNVIVQSAFGSPRSASHRVMRALDAGRFRAVFSPAALDELVDVLLLPQIRARHGWTDDQVTPVCRLVLTRCPHLSGRAFRVGHASP
jgi:predicted nucleic acid-binding protein